RESLGIGTPHGGRPPLRRRGSAAPSRARCFRAVERRLVRNRGFPAPALGPARCTASSDAPVPPMRPSRTESLRARRPRTKPMFVRPRQGPCYPSPPPSLVARLLVDGEALSAGNISPACMAVNLFSNVRQPGPLRAFYERIRARRGALCGDRRCRQKARVSVLVPAHA